MKSRLSCPNCYRMIFQSPQKQLFFQKMFWEYKVNVFSGKIDIPDFIPTHFRSIFRLAKNRRAKKVFFSKTSKLLHSTLDGYINPNIVGIVSGWFILPGKIITLNIITVFRPSKQFGRRRHFFIKSAVASKEPTTKK